MLTTGFDVWENLKGYHIEMEILKASDKKSLCKLGKIVQFINSCLTDPFFLLTFLIFILLKWNYILKVTEQYQNIQYNFFCRF